MVRVDGVQTFGFLPKPMKKLAKTERDICSVAITAASWSVVLLVRHVLLC